MGEKMAKECRGYYLALAKALEWMALSGYDVEGFIIETGVSRSDITNYIDQRNIMLTDGLAEKYEVAWKNNTENFWFDNK